MKIYEKIMVETSECAGIKCDHCGKTEKNPNDWHNFSSSHQGWGNDSIDSFEQYDVCSVDCYIKISEKAIEDVITYTHYRAEVDGMNVLFAQKLLNQLKK